jgi:uncharacterized membrane protein YecN with MAPEG domain
MLKPLPTTTLHKGKETWAITRKEAKDFYIFRGGNMIFPAVTAFYAALLGVVFSVLSGWVIAGRFKLGVLHGDGGKDSMLIRMRTHANFAEYVPFILLLAGLYEASGGSRGILRALLIVLSVARVMHPVGMVAPPMSFQQFAFRATSVIATLAVLIAVSVLLLTRLAAAAL